MPPAQPNEQQVLDAIVERAGKDRAFRRELLTNPRQAIHGAFGVQIPDAFRVRFIERDVDVDALIVLPELDLSEEAELSDEELETVAGGANAHAAWAAPKLKIKLPPHVG